MNPLIFAILAAITFGFWTIFHKLAAPYINQVFGAVLVSFTAVILGGLFLLSGKTEKLYTNSKGIIFLILAGICAFAIDYFALKAYAKGLPVTIGGPIIIGGSIAIAVTIGFFMGDSVTLPKILGLTLLTLGASILAVYS
jgi:bacterial/archaeal transporter family protein